MRYWVFTEEQLEAALRHYIARKERADRDLVHVARDYGPIVRDFLDSPEARVHKLQGGDSYQRRGKA